eukprot:gene26617-35290_t
MSPIPPEHDNVSSYGNLQQPSSKTVEGKLPLEENSVQIDGFVYNATRLAEMHPGGDLFVKAFAGHDATEAFLSYHRREFPHDRYSKLLVEDASGKAEPLKKPDSDKEFLELCRLVEQVLPRAKSFAPFHYYIKVAALLSLSIGLEVYIHSTCSYKWYLTGFEGFLFALIGLNIQHDANHGAISRYSWVNRILGLSQNWIGGSAVDWIHQHVVQHHINPNHTHKDPDIVGNPLLRLNPLKSLEKHQFLQHIYVFFLLALFGFTYIVDSFIHNFEGFHFTKMSSLLIKNRPVELATIALFFFRWVALPLYQQFSVYTLLQVAPLFMVGGYYLSFFFVISHNFEGVYLFGPTAEEKYDSFLHKQVATASNVGGSWLCFLNGGLNYQIEHHLFPRIQHSHYPKIAPIVREYCLSKGIPYIHFPTVADNVASTIRHLSQMGHTQLPSGFQKAA